MSYEHYAGRPVWCIEICNEHGHGVLHEGDFPPMPAVFWARVDAKKWLSANRLRFEPDSRLRVRRLLRKYVVFDST